MSLDVQSPPDITYLALREAALAISDRSDFTIGRVTVNYAALLRKDGMTHRGLALQEARSLGKRMLEVHERVGRYPEALVSDAETEEARTSSANRVLTTGPMLISKLEFDEATGRPLRPHAWTFGTSAITSGPTRTDLLSVRLVGKVFDLAGEVSDGLENEQEENYRRSMRGLAAGPITSDRLPAPKPGEPEDPNDLFYVAELGLLRVARTELYDRAAGLVIE